MPKLTEIQKNAIDIIDIIHFFNIYTGHNVFLTSGDLKKERNYEFFETIISLIDKALEKNNIPQEKLVYFKHYLLCGVEIRLNEIDYDEAEKKYPNIPKRPSEIPKETFIEVQEFNKNYCTGLLSIFLKKRNINFNLYLSILNEIIESLRESDFPSSCYFRLNFRALAFQYPLASISVYRKFLEHGILNNSRYQHKDKDKDKELNETIFLRSLLAIEFEIFRDFSKYYLNTELDKNNLINFSELKFIEKDSFPDKNYIESTVKYYKKKIEMNLDFYYFDKKPSFYILGNMDSKDDIINLLKFMNKNYIHHNFFSNKQSNLIGTIGSQLIFYFLYTFYDDKAIYCEYKSKKGLTWSEIASNSLFDAGFYISPRTLYLHYKEHKKLKYEQIRLFETIIHFSCGYSWNATFHDLFLFAYKYDPSSNLT